MLTRIKTNLGISHSSLDAEINALIAAARSELVRLGVNEAYANAQEGAYPVIDQAIIMYACYMRTIGSDEGKAYLQAWEYQSDCLRKSYGGLDEK